MSYNARKDDVYRKLSDLKRSIRMDSFNLTRDDQDFLELKLDGFRKVLDEKYGANMSI